MKSIFAAVAISICGSLAFAGEAIKNPLKAESSWIDLREDLIGDVIPTDGSSLFSFDAPIRAHDAATVPLVITQTDLDAAPITSAMVVIDENPAPMAAEITFGEAMAPLKFELRVRVDMYSNVRVIAKSADGNFMNGRFVKASGGCSAPATKDAALALAAMGQMKLKHFGDTPAMSNQRREAQVMLRHPNYSGLQRDQITQLFIGAHFIDKFEVFQGEEMLFSVEGGISISENPVFRFDYTDNGSTTLRVRATDTDGNIFEETLAKDAQT